MEKIGRAGFGGRRFVPVFAQEQERRCQNGRGGRDVKGVV